MSENMKGGNMFGRLHRMNTTPNNTSNNTKPEEKKPEEPDEKKEFKTYTREQLEGWKDFFTKNEDLVNNIVTNISGTSNVRESYKYKMWKYSGYIARLLNNDGDPIYDTERYLDKIDIDNFITELKSFITDHKHVLSEDGGKRRSKKKSSKRKSKRKSSKKGRKSRRKRRTRK